MTLKVQEYLEVLKRPPEIPSFEPEIDDLDEKKDKELRELEDLSSGAVQTGQIEPGDGGASPGEGCLVYTQVSIKDAGGKKVLQTTRSDEGGSGVPLAFVAGKGRRAPRGWELAVADMTRGQRVFLKLKPDYGFAQKDCRFSPPAGFSADSDFVFDLQLVNFYPSKGIKLADESGEVIKRPLTEPTSWETPRAPFEVTVTCKARVPSSSGRQGEGTPFFSTPPDKPLRFAIGDKSVPSDFEAAVCSLSKGEQAIVSCPASGLREDGSSGLKLPVPGGIDRVELELHLQHLLEVRDMTGTGEVTKRRVKDGVGEFPADCPLEDCSVQVHYRAWLPDKPQDVLYDSRGQAGAEPPLQFDTGMGAVPEAVDMSIRLMTPEETSLVTAAAPYAYQGRDDRPAGIPEGAAVQFEVTLVSFDRQPNWSMMEAGAKLQRAQELKAQGNAVFKAGLGSLAKPKWTKALKLLNHLFDIESEEQEQEVMECKTACMVNLALLMHKQGDNTEAFTWCERALKEQPDHAKALYRRAMVHADLHNYEAAREDLQAARAADPSCAPDIDKELSRLKAKETAANSRQRKEFRNFFGGK